MLQSQPMTDVESHGASGLRVNGGGGQFPLLGLTAPNLLPQGFNATSRSTYGANSQQTRDGQITMNYTYRPGDQLADVASCKYTNEDDPGYVRGHQRRAHIVFAGVNDFDRDAVVLTSLAALNTSLRNPMNPLNKKNTALEVMKYWRYLGTTLNMKADAAYGARPEATTLSTISRKGRVYDMPNIWFHNQDDTSYMCNEVGSHLWLVLMKVQSYHDMAAGVFGVASSGSSSSPSESPTVKRLLAELLEAESKLERALKDVEPARNKYRALQTAVLNLPTEESKIDASEETSTANAPEEARKQLRSEYVAAGTEYDAVVEAVGKAQAAFDIAKEAHRTAYDNEINTAAVRADAPPGPGPGVQSPFVWQYVPVMTTTRTTPIEACKLGLGMSVSAAIYIGVFLRPLRGIDSPDSAWSATASAVAGLKDSDNFDMDEERLPRCEVDLRG